MRRVAVLLLFLLVACISSIPIQAADEKNTTEYCMRFMHGSLDLFNKYGLFFTDQPWVRADVARAILKEMGKEQEVRLVYRNFFNKQDIDSFYSRMDDELKKFFDTKENKLLYAKRIVRRILDVTDKYRRFYTSDQLRDELKDSLYRDDGLLWGAQNDELLVIGMVPDSSADKAGFLPCDKIVKINDEDVTKKANESEEALERRAWSALVAIAQKNQPIKYTVKRDGKLYEFTTVFGEQREKNASLVTSEKDGRIGILTIKSFYSYSVSDQFVAEYKKLMQAGVQALIINVKDNGGGYVDQMLRVLAAFLPEDKPAFLVQNKNGTRYIFSYPWNEKDVPRFGGPIVILTNGGTASAAEDLAAALTRLRGAMLIGTPTFGKSVGQNFLVLDDGTAIRLTTFVLYTSDGYSVEGGLLPDMEVAFEEGKRNAFALAKDYLNRMLDGEKK